MRSLKSIVFELLKKGKCTDQRIVNLAEEYGAKLGDNFLRTAEQYKYKYHKQKQLNK